MKGDKRTTSSDRRAARRALMRKTETPEIVPAPATRDWTEVRDSPVHGKGLFATKDLAVGDVVLCEKSLFAVMIKPEYPGLTHVNAAVYLVGHSLEQKGKTAKDSKAALEKVSRLYPASLDAERLKQARNEMWTQDGLVHHFMSLEKGQEVERLLKKILEHKKEDELVLTYERLYTNAFLAEEFGAVCWYEKAGVANHACDPNAWMTTESAHVVFRALKPIASGEEVRFRYTSENQKQYHRAVMKQQYRFDCGCEPFPQDACWNCEGKTEKPVRCKACDVASYCSLNCLVGHWKTCHEHECVAVQALVRRDPSLRSEPVPQTQ